MTTHHTDDKATIARLEAELARIKDAARAVVEHWHSASWPYVQVSINALAKAIGEKKSTLQPTMRFRWFRFHMGCMQPHPTALRIGDSLYAQVLQQRWEYPNDEGCTHPGEWRDIQVGYADGEKHE